MTSTPSRFESDAEYRNWVRHVAMGRIERDPASFRDVARACVVYPQYVGGELALTQSCEPYLYPDEHRIGTRVWPSEVIHHNDEHPLTDDLPDDLRALAVELLTQHLYQETVDLEAEQEAESA